MANRIGIINKGKLILVEEKESLMKKLGSKKLLISLYRSLAEIPQNLLKFNLQLVGKGNILVFSYDPSKEDNAISELLDRLKENSIQYKDIDTQQNSLEEIFVQLVNA